VEVRVATVEVNVLGGFAVVAGGERIDGPWRLRKAKTLVKLLALAPDHRMHRDVVIDRLWPDADSESGANNLHQALHAARRVVGNERLVLRDEMVVLGPSGDVAVDVDTFMAAAAQADATVASLAAALSHWTGDLLPEDLYEDWVAPHREQLASRRDRLILRLAAALVEQGDAGEAALLLEPLAVERADDEEVHRALLEALFAGGRRSDAVQAFDRLRDALEEYGAAPSRATADLFRRLSTGGGVEHTMVANNLPAPATSFIGRSRELRDLSTALDRSRLVTITGPGGAGKTRLALELARRRAATSLHPDGVWVVELAAVTDQDVVVSAVATALDLQLPGRRPPVNALMDQLTGRHLLLVLDNCEHLLTTVAALVGELLARCPDLVVLTTSREPLALTAEIAWRTPSLNLPPVEGIVTPSDLTAVESVELFMNRAWAVAPSFDLDEKTAPVVAAICRDLDGIPLALELAAARLAHLSANQILDRLGDALGVLASRGHPVDRQQTLAATLDWSYQLLNDEERGAFRRLAVFAGGFDLDAASELCGIGDPISMLGRLVDKSLVVADASGTTARYRLLEVVRQYAEARLTEAGDLEQARRRHRVWFATQAASHDPDRGVPVVLEPSSWFDTERDNLRAALLSALREQPCLALELAISTWRFWLSRGQIADGLNWLGKALQDCRQPSTLRARALFASGVLHVRRSQVRPLLGVVEELAALEELLGDDVRRADSTYLRAAFSWLAHDWPRACHLAAEAMALGAVDHTVAVSSQHLAGLLALGVGRLDDAADHFAAATSELVEVPPAAPPFFSAMTICWVTDDRSAVPIPIAEDSMLLGRRVGAEQARGYLEAATAIVERLSGSAGAALGLLEAAIGRFTALDDVYGLAYATGQRAHTLRWMGDLEDAIRAFERVEEYRTSLRDVRAVAMSVAGRVVAEAMLGRGRAARRRAAEIIDWMRRTGDVPGIALTLHTAGLVEALLGDDAAALPLVAESIRVGEETLPIHALGWQRLFHAQLMTNVGDLDGAETASALAADRFAALDDKLGLAAVQRPRKAVRITIPGG
jgi:predicted ATPase/DNA-binding SARP family transcriptional activator